MMHAKDGAEWVEQVSAIVTKDGKHALLFKAVRETGFSAKSITAKAHQKDSYYKGKPDVKNRMIEPYDIGRRLMAKDFKANANCGHGLHLSPTPEAAQRHDYRATRIMVVEVRIEDINPLPSYWSEEKCKVETLRVVGELPKGTFNTGHVAHSSAWNPKVGHTFTENRSGNMITITELDNYTIKATRENGKSTTMMRRTLQSNYSGRRQQPAVTTELSTLVEQYR